MSTSFPGWQKTLYFQVYDTEPLHSPSWKHLSVHHLTSVIFKLKFLFLAAMASDSLCRPTAKSYSMLNTWGLMPEGKNIVFKIVKGIWGGLSSSQGLHLPSFTCVTIVSSGRPRCLPAKSIPYLHHAPRSWDASSVVKLCTGLRTRLCHWCEGPRPLRLGWVWDPEPLL